MRSDTRSDRVSQFMTGSSVVDGVLAVKTVIVDVQDISALMGPGAGGEAAPERRCMIRHIVEEPEICRLQAGPRTHQ